MIASSSGPPKVRTPVQPGSNDGGNVTAGTAIVAALTALDPHSLRKLAGQETKHQTAEEIRAAIGKPAYDETFSFAVVRNPFDRICSLYRFLREHPKFVRKMKQIDSFKSFITKHDDNRHWVSSLQSMKPQCHFLCDKSGELLVSRVIRFETLQNEFQSLQQELGIQATLTTVKKSNWRGDDYEQMFDEQTREIVRSRFKQDFQRFGYTE